jgi:hypothetical protein
MGFALWIDDDTAWAQGTHEYKPMGAAVIAVNGQFRARDFNRYRRSPDRMAPTFQGLFASLEDLNGRLRSPAFKKNFRPSEVRTRSII